MAARTLAQSANAGALALEQGRDSFQKQAWGAVFAQLSAADNETPLSPEDLTKLAQAALLIGREAEGLDYLTRAHQAFANRGDRQPAARCAFWLGFTALLNGEAAKAGGWLSRAGRLLEDCPECVERGYLLLPRGYQAFHTGDPATAHAAFVEAAAIGKAFGDKDLLTLALQGQGRSLIRQGQTDRGLALLDEAMIAVIAGEVSALSAGGVYCSVLDACGEVFDLQRAHEWTTALERWCASQPDIVPYRGHCLLQRAELLQLHGAWPDAIKEAQRARDSLSHPTPKASVGAAYYILGEVYRLRGKFAEAEGAYRQASQWQSNPGPGLAQLRLAQGEIEAATATIRHLAESVREPRRRAHVLDAYVQIALAGNDLPAARSASEELAQIAADHRAPFLEAMSSLAAGAVALASDDPQKALTVLHRSFSLWREIEAPYEASRTRILIGIAFGKLGDEETAHLELTAARQTFQELGAAVDLARVDVLLSKDAKKEDVPLTERELEVIKQVATGSSNREIAKHLGISEKTVARHLSNIFTKLNLYSRTAAAAYAYDHNLV